MQKKKVVLVVHRPYFINVFLWEIVNFLNKQFNLTIVTDTEHNIGDLKKLPKDIKIHHIPFEREIKPIKDFLTFLKIFMFFIKNRDIHISLSYTMKAGFFTSILAFLFGVPNRVHGFTGQIWINDSGFKRFLYKNFDKTIGKFSQYLLIDSFSQKEFLIREGVVKKEKAIVFGKGSIKGVDLKRFYPSITKRKNFRKKIMVSDNLILLTFLGRINSEKGIQDIIYALNNLHNLHQKICLLIIGRVENESFKKKLNNIYNKNYKLIFHDYTHSPEEVLCATDILLLPSKREGFGQVVIEAAACKVPSIVSNIVGLRDTIEDFETGLKFKPGDLSDLERKIEFLVEKKSERLRLGDNGYDRVSKLFDSKKVFSEQKSFFQIFLD